METLLLHANWTVKAIGGIENVPTNIVGKEIPATVPGCVHTDLMAAGMIEDPYIDRNENKVKWIGLADWRYRCTFDVPAAMLERQRIDLVCQGLDTVARIELNGVVLGESFNMHHPHEFNAKNNLRPGENELAITFRSPIVYAREIRDAVGHRTHLADYEPYNCIRKMACNFGWDWGPILTTSGIWQPIMLRAWDVARVKAVRPLVTKATPAAATMDVIVDLEWAGPRYEAEQLAIDLHLAAPDGNTICHQVLLAPGQARAEANVNVAHPQLWWPAGHGAQPLYDLVVTLGSAKRGLPALDAWTGRVGLRTTRLRTEADEIGSKFVIEINSKPIFCLGANWIPDDCFLHRVDEQRYRQRLEQVRQSNMNMLRVWGGGIFETETFYRLCDEMGIMVWQDFLFACAFYPEEEPTRSQVEAEARYNIVRLASHTSLVIWNGCNENIWAWHSWGNDKPWRDQLHGKTWGAGYYFDLLPRLVAELDPSRPYWPGSPYSGTMDIDPGDDNHGNDHVWDAWNHKDYTVYLQYAPRFVSEFGFQGPPTYATLARSVPPDQRSWNSPSMEHHQRSWGHQKLMSDRTAEHFDLPENFDDMLFLGQLNQARAVQCAVEHWRAAQPRCMGALYWQINDCWPVSSWASVDGDGRPKPLWFATRRFYAPRMLTIEAQGPRLGLWAINDTDQQWDADVELARMNFTGDRLAQTVRKLAVPPRSARRVVIIPAKVGRADDPAAELILADAAGVRCMWFYDIDKCLNYPAPAFDADLLRAGDTYFLTITARTLLRDLAVFPDRLDDRAEVSDQLVTLLNGESFTFRIRSDKDLTREQLTSPPVMQCANRFGAKVTT